MKELFANPAIGLPMLLFFFVVFVAIGVWALRPDNKKKFENYAQIPFKEKADD